MEATKIASALARRGFKQGDVLYFCTYELAHLFLVKIGVWMLGGVVRGCFQGETPGNIYCPSKKYRLIKIVF